MSANKGDLMYARMKTKLADIDNNENFKEDSLSDLIHEARDAVDSQKFID